MPVRYPYSDIKKITNDFKEKLDEGALAYFIKESFVMVILQQ